MGDRLMVVGDDGYPVPGGGVHIVDGDYTDVQADQPEPVHVVDNTDEVHVVDYPHDGVHVVDNPGDVHVVDHPDDVHVVDHPGDVHVVDHPSDVHIVDGDYSGGYVYGPGPGVAREGDAKPSE